jgi:hypothetical protein
MYYNQFYFDDMEQTGNQIRIKNKLKAKNLMALSVNFLDPDVLQQMQKIFMNLTPQEMDTFKKYLNNRDYLRNSFQNPKEQAIINKISRLALASAPKDEYLNKIMKKYNQNLEEIDRLKIETTKTIDGVKVNKLIEQIDILNDENVQLFEKVTEYREKNKQNS